MSWVESRYAVDARPFYVILDSGEAVRVDPAIVVLGFPQLDEEWEATGNSATNFQREQTSKIGENLDRGVLTGLARYKFLTSRIVGGHRVQMYGMIVQGASGLEVRPVSDALIKGAAVLPALAAPPFFDSVKASLGRIPGEFNGGQQEIPSQLTRVLEGTRRTSVADWVSKSTSIRSGRQKQKLCLGAAGGLIVFFFLGIIVASLSHPAVMALALLPLMAACWTWSSWKRNERRVREFWEACQISSTVELGAAGKPAVVAGTVWSPGGETAAQLYSLQRFHSSTNA